MPHIGFLKCAARNAVLHTILCDVNALSNELFVRLTAATSEMSTTSTLFALAK